MFELTENHFRKLFSVKSTRLAATENRFSGKSFPFDQNLHLLTRKSFYIVVLPSNDFRSCESNTLSQNTWNTRPNATRERDHSQRERERSIQTLRRSASIVIAIDASRERVDCDRDRAKRRPLRSWSRLRLFGVDDFFLGFVCVLRNKWYYIIVW